MDLLEMVWFGVKLGVGTAVAIACLVLMLIFLGKLVLWLLRDDKP